MDSLKGKKILIVEDDEMLRDILCDIFSSEQAEVIQAVNANEALSILKDNSIDAVMTDMRMEGGDGISLLIQFSSLPRPRPALFVCTGFNELSPELIKKYGIVKIFEKPFDKNELISSVLNHLKS